MLFIYTRCPCDSCLTPHCSKYTFVHEGCGCFCSKHSPLNVCESEVHVTTVCADGMVVHVMSLCINLENVSLTIMTIYPPNSPQVSTALHKWLRRNGQTSYICVVQQMVLSNANLSIEWGADTFREIEVTQTIFSSLCSQNLLLNLGNYTIKFRDYA